MNMTMTAQDVIAYDLAIECFVEATHAQRAKYLAAAKQMTINIAVLEDMKSGSAPLGSYIADKTPEQTEESQTTQDEGQTEDPATGEDGGHGDGVIHADHVFARKAG